MKSLIPLLVCLLALVFPTSASARIIGVPGDSPTIQSGIDASTPGDTVLVQPGRYLETIDFKGKNIVLGSLYITTQDTSYISKTIIDANKMNTVVAFQSGETTDAELCGFTITNGVSQARPSNGGIGNIGGGIFCRNASPYLHHLNVTNNLSYVDGGGMYLEKSNSVIENCVISGNRAVGAGGGMYIDKGDNEIKSSVINNNEGNWGGGIAISYSKVEFFRVLMTNNNHNSALEVSLSKINIINCTIADQFPETFVVFNSDVNIVNSIFWNNSPQILITNQNINLPVSNIMIAFSVIKNGKDSIKIWSVTDDQLLWKEGNTENDPHFIDNNYSLNKTSPCIDSGISKYIVDGKTIVDLDKSEFQGLAPDIGAIESDFTQTHIHSSAFLDYGIEAFPNPFNSTTSIAFELSMASEINMSVYSITGQKIKEIVSGYLSSGKHAFTWNGKDDSGKRLSSGVYFARLDDGTHAATRKLLLMK